MLAREVQCMPDAISCECPWEVMPDLYFYRDFEDMWWCRPPLKKAVTKEEFLGEWTVPAPEFTVTHPEVTDWSKGMEVHSGPIQQFPTEG